MLALSPAATPPGIWRSSSCATSSRCCAGGGVRGPTRAAATAGGGGPSSLSSTSMRRVRAGAVASGPRTSPASGEVESASPPKRPILRIVGDVPDSSEGTSKAVIARCNGAPATRWRSNRGPGRPGPPVPYPSGDHAVGVEDVLAGRALVEVLVALGGLVERDHGRVDVLGDLHLVVEDRHHQLAVVLHHRALAGLERVGLGPAEPDPDRQRPDLGRLVDRARVAGHVQPGDAELPGRP